MSAVARILADITPNIADARAPVGAFHPGEYQRCPHCNSTQWFIGRVVATCARCEMPMPIVIIFEQPQSDEGIIS